MAQSNRKFSWELVLLAAVLTLALGALALLAETGLKMTERNAPMVDASIEIKYKLSVFHLWIEESLIGDKSVSVDAIWTPLKDAEAYALAMMDGGRVHDLTIPSLADAELRASVGEVLADIRALGDVARRRLALGSSNIAGTSIDLEFDGVFAKAIDAASAVETILLESVDKQLWWYRALSFGLGGGMILSIVFVGIVFLRNETERKALLTELRESHDDLEDRVEERSRELHKLYRAIEQSPQMIFITDPSGTIEYVNPMFTTLSGYTAEEAIGQNPRILKSNETPLLTYKKLWKTITSGHEWRAEIKDRRKDGSTFWASTSISPVRAPDGSITHFIAMHEDITERKEAEIHVREAREQAEVANRAKSELLANMSHELRTPLNAILGFSQTIMSGLFGPLGNDKYAEYIADIYASGEHLLELINDILDVSAIEAGKLKINAEKLDLTEIADAALRLIRARADQNNVKLVRRFAADVPAFKGDERRIKQILLNLLSNAVKFTPEGGKVTVSLSHDPDGRVRITVADTGIGMDEKGIAKAMTQFGQVDSKLARKFDGTGLGLPLTGGLVELHGGTMDIRSRPGHGTTVTVMLPAERVIIQ